MAVVSRPIITLTTDFGTNSAYVAQMKGVILTLNPEAVLVDITHAIAPQDIRQGAVVLEEVAPRFPGGTIHIVVVDPGVGTARRLVCAEVAGHCYLAPDNGLLSRLTRSQPASRIVALTNREYWLPQVSHTFHGRDILAPVAAHLSLGVPPQRLGEPVEHLTTLDWPEAVVELRRIAGIVLCVDSFGNVISNIPAVCLPPSVPRDQLLVHCGGHEVRGVQTTYSERPAGTLLALVDSQDRLEVAISGGNAAAALRVQFGDPVVVTWHRDPQSPDLPKPRCGP